MKDKPNQSRRDMLKLGGMALAMIPVAAFAAKNDLMRTQMKYQDKPEGEKQCDNCAQWVPGKTPKDLGGCKLFPNDNEVSPKGYCVTWVKRP